MSEKISVSVFPRATHAGKPEVPFRTWGRLKGYTTANASHLLKGALSQAREQFPDYHDRTSTARVEDFKREVAKLIERHTEALEAAG